jgi:hypothetical protein
MTRAVRTPNPRSESATGDALMDALIAAATVDTAKDGAGARAADTVYDIAGGDPDVLEQARIILQRRLAHRSDDFSAGRGLRAVRAALERTAPPEGPLRWQDDGRRK